MATNPLQRPRVVLELDLTTEVLEAPPSDPLAALQARRKIVLRDLQARLRRAARDPAVWGLLVRVGSTPTGLARLQELRMAVLDFRRSGKPAIAWAESFGEFGPGTAPYYVATAFDEIWLQPSGEVGLTGVALEARFLREALDKVGVQPEFERRHEYKNAANTFTEREFTAAHREATEGLVGSVADHLLRVIGSARRIDVDSVRAIVDRAPIPADEALSLGLVDRLGYRDEIYAAIRQRAGDGAHLRYLSRYRPPPLDRLQTRWRRAVGDPRKIALVQATGTIMLGRSRRSPFGVTAGADSVISALRAAARDRHVAAVVLRVDSPGGSYVASDAIHRAVSTVRRSGRPLIVSMGDLAASGGYFISMGADKIVSNPGTITGSIGVLGGKLVVDRLLGRLGVGHDAVFVGEHARILSSVRPFTPGERAALNRFLDRVYADFVAKAAAGRGRSFEQMHDLARGRIWSGADALDRGLVDALGGLDLAISEARKAANLREDAPVVAFPHITPVQRFRAPESSEDPQAAASTFLAGWGSFASLAEYLGLPAAGPLVLPAAFRLS